MSRWTLLIEFLQNLLFSSVGPVVFGSRRSAGWPRVRREHLKKQPACCACGNTKSVEVHHKIPFHLAPELELDRHNLMTLCEDGPGGMSCHYVVGHRAGGWQDANPNAERDAAYIFAMLNPE